MVPAIPSWASVRKCECVNQPSDDGLNMPPWAAVASSADLRKRIVAGEQAFPDAYSDHFTVSQKR